MSSATVNKPVGFYSRFINSQFSERYLAYAVGESIDLAFCKDVIWA